MVCTFTIKSIVHSYHEYKCIWENPVHSKELDCTMNIGNSHDLMVVAIMKESGASCNRSSWPHSKKNYVIIIQDEVVQ